MRQKSYFTGLLLSGMRLALVSLLMTALQGAAQGADKPRIKCLTISEAPIVDGSLDEPQWQAADRIENLTMIEPEEGAPPSCRTEVRVLADPKNLYIGIDCFDPDPSGIVAYTVARDARLSDEDHIKVVLDGFRDGRGGYVFAVNPLGARYDALVSDRGERENRNWDGIWEARTERHSRGWSAEIRIPIFTLRYNGEIDSWHFNVQRRIQRFLETDRWADPDRDHRLTQTRHAGLLVDLPPFDLGLGLSVRPALVTGVERASRDDDRDYDTEMSLDVTQKLGPNLTAQLTVNTDFAETEVDTRRTNLTRFPLFFPEKRSFFLEGSEFFDFGLGIGRDAIPYHSRRIGLVDDEEVPLQVGAKVHGQMEGTHIGFLGVNMGRESSVAPETNMGVLRLRQNVLAESSVGLIATRGDPLGRRGSYTMGADFTYQTSEFRGDKNFLVGAWGLTMDRDEIEGSSRNAMGCKVDYPNDLWDVALTYKRVGEDFDPSLGFVPRAGIHKYQTSVNYKPHSDLSFLRRMYYELYTTYITTIDGPWESYRVFTAPLHALLESGDSCEFNVMFEGENLFEPFEISDDVELPAESYDWVRYRAQVESASKRVLSAELSWEFGDFYNGTLDTYEVELEWNPIPLLTLELMAERNEAELDEGDFSEDVYGTRVQFNFSPDLVLSSFTQHQTSEDEIGTNTRLRWSITPESNLYLVFNYNWSKIDRHWKRESYQSTVKVEYTFRF